MRSVWFVVLAGCGAAAQQPSSMTLTRVILYQNGIGYFERAGHVTGKSMQLALGKGELDDVLKTLTVFDRLGASVALVDVPSAVPSDARGDDVVLGVRLAGGRVHDLTVGYATPTPTWKAAYRVVVGADHSVLQAWAIVNNASRDDWRGVRLTLATGAPMSLAMDLHTPQYVGRPDATGRLVTPVLTGAVGMETAGAADRDGDGIPDAVDKCPDDASGVVGDDGCPGHGRVVVSDSAVVVLEPLRFPKNADVLPAEAGPILDAIASTLAANPDIEVIELGGNASADEADVWALAMRRAEAVRAALAARGVASARMKLATYGATRTGAATVETLVVKRRDDGGGEPHAARRDPVADATASVHAAVKPADVAGAVRFELTEPVSIRRGASAMVSILDKAIDAHDVYLWRPDANAPGSDRHPFRAVELANTSGFTLAPGPIAIFARGTFVGDSLLQQLGVGETAWVPYAIDGATTVTADASDGEQPVRVASVHRGVATVEAALVRTTRYTIDAGREPAATIYLRHPRAAGFVARDLPPGTIDQGDAYLVPLPLVAGKTSTLAIEERRTVDRTIELASGRADEVAAYAAGPMTADARERLRAAIAVRGDVARLEAELDTARERMGDVASRAGELRASLTALDKVANADDLRRKLVASLAATTAETDALARTLADRGAELATARARLADAIRDLEI
jgi:outer membrane protein OmpA-like peptidoglycan-associated protein|nr:OmpA family protein [Kofleriaceae bacterium]